MGSQLRTTHHHRQRSIQGRVRWTMGGVLSPKSDRRQSWRSCQQRRQDWRSWIDRQFDRKSPALRNSIGTSMEGMGRKSTSAKVDRCLKSYIRQNRELISNRSSLRRGHMFASVERQASRSIRSRRGPGIQSSEFNIQLRDRRRLFGDDSPGIQTPPKLTKRVTTTRTSQAGQVRTIIHIGHTSLGVRHQCPSDFGSGMTGRNRLS